jgi:hypothetical protein
MTWSGTRVLRHTLQFLVLMLSWFTALSRVSDFKHHWSDVLAGYTLGAIAALLMVNNSSSKSVFIIRVRKIRPFVKTIAELSQHDENMLYRPHLVG